MRKSSAPTRRTSAWWGAAQKNESKFRDSLRARPAEERPKRDINKPVKFQASQCTVPLGVGLHVDWWLALRDAGYVDARDREHKIPDKWTVSQVAEEVFRQKDVVLEPDFEITGDSATVMCCGAEENFVDAISGMETFSKSSGKLFFVWPGLFQPTDSLDDSSRRLEAADSLLVLFGDHDKPSMFCEVSAVWQVYAAQDLELQIDVVSSPKRLEALEKAVFEVFAGKTSKLASKYRKLDVRKAVGPTKDKSLMLKKLSEAAGGVGEANRIAYKIALDYLDEVVSNYQLKDKGSDWVVRKLNRLAAAGQQSLEKKNFSDALKMFEEGLGVDLELLDKIDREKWTAQLNAHVADSKLGMFRKEFNLSAWDPEEPDFSSWHESEHLKLAYAHVSKAVEAGRKADVPTLHLVEMLDTLAAVTFYLDKGSESKQAYQEAVELRNSLETPAKTADASRYTNLAKFVLKTSDNVDEAITLLNAALEVNLELYPEKTHPDVGRSYIRLAELLAKSDPEKACAHYEDGIVVLKNTIGKRGEVAVALRELSELYSSLNKRELAMRAAEEAVSMTSSQSASTRDLFSAKKAVDVSTAKRLKMVSFMLSRGNNDEAFKVLQDLLREETERDRKTELARMRRPRSMSRGARARKSGLGLDEQKLAKEMRVSSALHEELAKYYAVVLGDLSAAQTHFEESIEKARLAGDLNKRLADLLYALSRTHLRQEETVKAQQVFNEAEEVMQVLREQTSEFSTVGDELSSSAVSTAEGDRLASIAKFEAEAGNDSESISMMKKAVTKYRDFFNNESSDEEEEFAIKLQEAGEFFLKTESFENAKDVLQQASDLFRRIKDESKLAVSLHDLAEALRETGNVEKAEKAAQESLRLGRALLGDRHPDVAARQASLATVLHDNGEFDEALNLRKEVCRTYAEVFGDDSEELATALLALAETEQELGMKEDAVINMKRALQARTLAAPHDYRNVDNGSLMWWIANLLVDVDQSNVDEARAFAFTALSILREVLGADHPNVSTLARQWRLDNGGGDDDEKSE